MLKASGFLHKLDMDHPTKSKFRIIGKKHFTAEIGRTYCNILLYAIGDFLYPDSSMKIVKKLQLRNSYSWSDECRDTKKSKISKTLPVCCMQ